MVLWAKSLRFDWSHGLGPLSSWADKRAPILHPRVREPRETYIARPPSRVCVCTSECVRAHTVSDHPCVPLSLVNSCHPNHPQGSSWLGLSDVSWCGGRRLGQQSQGGPFSLKSPQDNPLHPGQKPSQYVCHPHTPAYRLPGLVPQMSPQSNVRYLMHKQWLGSSNQVSWSHTQARVTYTGSHTPTYQQGLHCSTTSS